MKIMSERIVFSIRGNPRRYTMPAPRSYSELGTHMARALTRDPYIVSEPTSMESLAARILQNLGTGTGEDNPVETTAIPMYTAEGDVSECTICMEQIKKNERFRRLPCSDTVNHCFHRQSIDEWLKTHNTCPNCRQQIG